jgi:hypothetical protein
LLRRREGCDERNKEKHKNGKGADIHGYIKTKLGSYFKTHLGITPLVRGVGKGGGLIVSTALGLYSEQRGGSNQNQPGGINAAAQQRLY